MNCINKYFRILMYEDYFIAMYQTSRCHCSVPEILAAFDCEEEALVNAVKEIIGKFDPDSPYWKVHGRNSLFLEVFKLLSCTLNLLFVRVGSTPEINSYTSS